MIPLANGAILAGIQINNLFIPEFFSGIEYMRKVASYESDKRKQLPANGSRKSFKGDDDCSRGVVLFVPHYSHFSRSRMRQNTNRPPLPFSLLPLLQFSYTFPSDSVISNLRFCGLRIYIMMKSYLFCQQDWYHAWQQMLPAYIQAFSTTKTYRGPMSI